MRVCVSVSVTETDCEQEVIQRAVNLTLKKPSSLGSSESVVIWVFNSRSADLLHLTAVSSHGAGARITVLQKGKL